MYQRGRSTTYTPYKTARRRQDHSLKIHTLMPHYVHAMQDHQQKTRPQPIGTCTDALLRTHYTRPPEEDKTTASRYLHVGPCYVHTTQDHQKTRPQPQGAYADALLRTHHTTTRRRKDHSLKVPTLMPYYVHTIQDHQKQTRP